MKFFIFKKNKKSNFSENQFYYEIDNFLTNEECDILINSAKNKLLDSKVMGVNENGKYTEQKNNARTSKHTWLNHIDHSNITNKVYNLVNKYSSVKVNKEQFEEIQVVRYKPGEKYENHYDICHPYQAFPEHRQTCKEDYENFKSVRYATVIFYLNDGFNGGTTKFTRLNKNIIPKKGKALIFFNCNFNKNTNKNGLCDVIYNSEHSGEPVYPGEKTDEKWIANIWIRTKEL